MNESMPNLDAIERIDIGMNNSNLSNFLKQTNKTIDNKQECFTNENGIYEIPNSLVIILSILYGIIILTALLGNTLVIYVVIVSPRMRTVTNFYIANLAFADVTIAMFAFPFQSRS